jgi:hypothetical protein
MYDLKNLKIGDKLVRTINPILTHPVIYVGFKFGHACVAENQYGYGVRYITLDQFLSEGTLVRVEKSSFSPNQQMQILRRIEQKINTPYHLIHYNCEHFANEIIHGIVESKQVKAVLIGLGFMTFVALSRKIK